MTRIVQYGVAGWGALLLAWSLLGCGDAPTPTSFNRDVAPILHERCAVCHRPAGAAPFSLLTYRDAKRRARQILEVTQSGYMPPWLPAEGPLPFADERRLSETELATLVTWVDGGLVKGAPSDLPPVPVFDDGWSLGPPDLELAMLEAYPLVAAGEDVYRNFVIAVPLDRTRYVRAVDFQPGNPAIVHHARLLLDRTPVSRYRDAESTGYGFEGMDSGAASAPDGHLLGWTPGKVPSLGREDLAWRLDPGDDLVLQLHMVPTGKSETIRSKIALYFAEHPPTKRPYALILGSRNIDIPPGERSYVVTDRYQMPVETEALGIYPHAHYVAREMNVWAELPDGRRESLIHVPEWDFNWQDEYRYESPLSLAEGSRIVMEFVYDNSSENVRNPSHPPRRVTYGANSTDEMAEVMIQVLPRDESDRAELESNFERFRIDKAIAYRKQLLETDPTDAASHSALASTYLYIDRPDLAIPHFEAALRVEADNAGLHQNLGYALRRADRLDEAVAHYERALELKPQSAESAFDLAQVYRSVGRFEEALDLYRQVGRVRPEMHAPFQAAAELLIEAPQLTPDGAATAVGLAERAARLTGNADAGVLETLARAYRADGQPARAEEARAAARRASAEPGTDSNGGERR